MCVCIVGLCVCVGFVMCECVYIWGLYGMGVCIVGFVMFGCVYVWVLQCESVCICGFCNVWVCVCVGFAM